MRVSYLCSGNRPYSGARRPSALNDSINHVFLSFRAQRGISLHSLGRAPLAARVRCLSHVTGAKRPPLAAGAKRPRPRRLIPVCQMVGQAFTRPIHRLPRARAHTVLFTPVNEWAPGPASPHTIKSPGKMPGDWLYPFGTPLGRGGRTHRVDHFIGVKQIQVALAGVA